MAYQYPLNGGRINASVGGNSTSAGAGYQLVSTGTLLLAGGNNITLSQNGSAITISGANAPSGSINFSAGTTSSNLNSVVFSNSNGVSFGLNGGTITGTVATNYAASNHSHGNPTLNLTNISGSTASASNGLTLSLSAPSQSYLSATGALSISTNGSTVSIGVPAFSAGASNLGNTAGNTGTVSGRIAFSGGNNITLSQLTAANGLATIGISGPSQSAQTIGGYATGNTTGQSSSSTFDARSLSVSALGGVSAGFSAGMMQMSAPDVSSLSHTGAVSISRNGNTISIGAPVQTAYSFANSNGVSFGTNGSTVTASHNGVTSQSNQNISLYALGNTTQNSSTLLNASNLSFNGLGGATVGFSNGSIQISGATGGGGGGIALANSQTTYSTGTVSLLEGAGAITIGSGTGQRFNISVPQASSISATGAVSISTNGNTISIGAPTQSVQTQGVQTINLGGNTSGAMASISSGALSLYGGNNITLSQNANSVTISGGGGGGGGGGIALANSQTTFTSGTANLNASGALTIASTTGQQLNFSVPATSLLTGVGGINISSNGGTVSISGAPAGTVSNWEPTIAQNASLVANQYMGAGSIYFYKLQPSVNVSASHVMQMISMSVSTSAANTMNGSLSLAAGIFTATGSTLSMITQSSATGSYGFTISSNVSSASYHGLHGLTIPLNVNMTPGNYWIGVWSRSTTATVGGAGPNVTVSNMMITNNAVSYLGIFGQAATANQGIQEAVGVYTSSSSAMISSAFIGSIVQSVRYLAPYMAFKNITW